MLTPPCMGGNLPMMQMRILNSFNDLPISPKSASNRCPISRLPIITEKAGTMPGCGEFVRDIWPISLRLLRDYHSAKHDIWTHDANAGYVHHRFDHSCGHP